MDINNEQWEINKKSLSSENGIVSSQNWIASSIGADVMNRGGNAIDAAVASAFALNVVEYGCVDWWKWLYVDMVHFFFMQN